MKISRAFLAVVATGALSFGVVVPAAASAHRTAVRLTAGAELRTVLVGSPIVIRGAVAPGAVGPIVLERLVNQDWVVTARARTTGHGGYSFTVGTAHHAGTWLLRVVRPATARTKEADSGVLRVQVATVAYTVAAHLEQPRLYVGDVSRLLGTVTPAPPGDVEVQRLVGSKWVTMASEPVGSNGGFSAFVTLPLGAWSVRALVRPTATVAGGTSPAVTAWVYPLPVS